MANLKGMMLMDNEIVDIEDIKFLHDVLNRKINIMLNYDRASNIVDPVIKSLLKIDADYYNNLSDLFVQLCVKGPAKKKVKDIDENFLR